MEGNSDATDKENVRIILENLRVKIPAELEKELLSDMVISLPMTAGHAFEYTEQDIYEQLRKKFASIWEKSVRICETHVNGYPSWLLPA